MKKILFSLFTFLVFGLGAQAQTFSVVDIDALATGETVTFTLHVEGAQGMTSVHFEATSSDFTFGKVIKTDDWNALFSTENGVVSGISTSDAAFSGDGDIAKVEVMVPANTKVGDYTVNIGNIRVNGETLDQEVSFTVKVIASRVTELNADEDGDFNPWIAENDGKTVNVKIKRTLPADEWSTLVLPFAMTLKQVQNVFGKKVEIADFDTANDEVENDKVTGIDINFIKKSALKLKIEANVPVIIKVDGGEGTYKGSIDVSGVKVVEVSYNDDNQSLISGAIASYIDEAYAEDYLLPIKFDNNLEISDYEEGSVNAFIGTYKSITGIGDYTNDFYIKGNKFYHANSAKAKPTRAYFCMEKSEYNPSGSDLPVRMVIHESDEATGIKSVKEVISLGGAIYNLQGQRVESVKKGLYIQNGKKYFVK